MLRKKETSLEIELSIAGPTIIISTTFEYIAQPSDRQDRDPRSSNVALVPLLSSSTSPSPTVKSHSNHALFTLSASSALHPNLYPSPTKLKSTASR